MFSEIHKAIIPSDNDDVDDRSQEENFLSRPSVHINVPDMIKGFLVDDWENVTKSHTLVALPSKAPVNWTIDTYFHEEKGSRRLGSPEALLLEDFTKGLKVYFGKMIGKVLLYKLERGQYIQVCMLSCFPTFLVKTRNSF